jgi:hypothetical protein
MKQMGKPILICLLCGIGFVLLLIAFVPYQSDGDAVSTQDAVPTPAKRQGSIRLSERAMRLKPVNSGETSSGFVIVENTGKKIITDIAIKVGCGCTDVKLSDTNINSGDSIRVDFSIDTKGKYEDFVERFIFTYSENGQNLYDVFDVTIPILAPGKLIAEPSSLQFYRAKVGESFSKNVELQVKDLPENESVDIVDVSTPDWMSASHIKKGTRWSLTLTGILPNQSGRYVEFIHVKSSSQRYSEMIIPIIVEYGTNSGSSPVLAPKIGDHGR